MAAWSRATGDPVTGASVLFGADEGIAGLGTHECQLVVLMAKESDHLEAGWFLSSARDVGLDSPTYAGRETFSPDAKALTLVAPASCGATPASPVASPGPGSTTAGAEVRFFALAAPGYYLQKCGCESLLPGEKPYSGVAIVRMATGQVNYADVYRSGKYVEEAEGRLGQS